MYEFVDYNGYFDEDGLHRCHKGHKTVYQLFSGGTEFYCKECDDIGTYPDDQVRIRAQLIKSEEGRKQLRLEIAEEIERRRMMLDG